MSGSDRTSPGRRRVARSALLLLLSTFVALAGGEVVLVVLGRYPPPRYPPHTRRPDLYESYEDYGYRLHPNLRTSYEYPEDDPRTLELVANSDGFRDARELREPDTRPRIMIVGDSFVFGEGVEAAERFPDILETRLAGWRVDNLGMVGYGPDLMLRAFESVGRQANPDVVILGIYTDDFRRLGPYYAGAGFQIPRYELDEGRLVTIPYPKPRIWNRLRLYEGFRQIRWSMTRSSWRLSEAILDRFVELSGEDGFDLVIVFLPGDRDTPVDQTRRRWLADFSADSELRYRDLTDVIHEQPRREVFIAGNWHLNPSGHALVAEALHRMLSEEGLVSPTGSETPR
ncbi:MAG: SGNH/GDSL hydrolase family protein [Gemmatimonadota bacterium]